MLNYKLLSFVFVISVLFWSCDFEEDNSYIIFDIYSFENVSYDGQVQCLQMFLEMKSYLGFVNMFGIVFDVGCLKVMYVNDVVVVNWILEYDVFKQLKSKIFEQE